MTQMIIESATSGPSSAPSPDHDADSKFVNAPDVEKIARALIGKYHSHLVEARIKYLFRRGAWKSKGDNVIGKAYMASERDRYLHGYDFLIVMNHEYWPMLTPPQREAAVDHELCHCSRGMDTGDGYPTWETRGHTVEEFTEIIRRHGLWREDVRQFIEAGVEATRQLTIYDTNDDERRVASG